MMLNRIAKGFKAVATRFVRSEHGNVAMIFAFSTPVILASIGAAIDYSRLSSARSSIQAAADAAALMISKEAATLTADQITAKAQAYFSALNVQAGVTLPPIKVTYTANSGNGASVVITAEGSMKSDFMSLNMPINISSTTKWGNNRYRVALALDNTGSMASASKMTELKTAANKFIEDFYKMATSNDDVYMSIVPFAKDVNIGSSFKNETWLKWSGATDSYDETAGSCSGWNGDNYTSKTSCQNAGRSWTSLSKNSWNGCVMDRTQSYDTTNETPSSGTVGTMVWPQQYDACPTRMLGMTSVKASKQTLLDKITAMSPEGGTNQQIGMFWAWMTHSSSGPFPNPAKDANYSYQDVIILLTDGLNTQNRFDGTGYSHAPAVDTRQALLCKNARDKGIKIFTIQVATDGDAVSEVTKNCATEPNNPNYFSYITSASQMSVKFENIFKELAKLRVAS